MGIWQSMERDHLKKLHLNSLSTVEVTWNLVEIGQVGSDEKSLNNYIMILYMYTAQGQGKITLTNKILIET